MSLDPYPDLPEPAADDSGKPAERPQLSEADSRLLDALTKAQPAVVSAVEDEPRRALVEADGPAPPVTGRRGSRTPVFQEPTG